MKQAIYILAILLLAAIAFGTSYSKIEDYTINESYIDYASNWMITLNSQSWTIDTANPIQCYYAPDDSKVSGTSWDPAASFCFDQINGIINFTGNNHTGILEYSSGHVLSDDAFAYNENWTDDATLDISGESDYTFSAFHNNYIWYLLSINQTYNGSHYLWTSYNIIRRADGSMYEYYTPRCELDYSFLFDDTAGQNQCHIWNNNEVVLDSGFSKTGFHRVEFLENGKFDCNGNQIIVNDFLLQNGHRYSTGLDIRNCDFINNDTDYSFILLGNILTPEVDMILMNNQFDNSGATGGISTLEVQMVNYIEPYSSFYPTISNLTLIGNTQIKVSTEWDMDYALIQENEFIQLSPGDITDGIIQNNSFEQSLSMQACVNCQITYNTFDANFYATALDNVVIENNDCYGRFYAGDTDNLIVRYNTFNDINQNDITFPYSDDSVIEYNSFNQADLVMYGTGIDVATNQIVQHNTFTDCGLYFSSTDDSLVRYNNFTNPIQGQPFYWGGGINTNITISHNRFTNIGNQSCVGDCDTDPSVFNAVSYNNQRLILFSMLTGSVIEYNEVVNLTGTFRMATTSTDNDIRYNTLTDASFFELRSGANNNRVYGNEMICTGRESYAYSCVTGLDLRDVTGNLVYSNTVTGDYGFGMRVRGSSSNNKIFSNNISLDMTTAYLATYPGLYLSLAGLASQDTATSNNLSGNIVIDTGNAPRYIARGVNSQIFEANSFTGGSNATDSGTSIWICNDFNGVTLIGAVNNVTTCPPYVPPVALPSTTGNTRYYCNSETNQCYTSLDEFMQSTRTPGVPFSLAWNPGQSNTKNPLFSLLAWIDGLTGNKWIGTGWP